MERRHENPGRREREAGKRHRRAQLWRSEWGAEAGPLKLGRKHMSRETRRIFSMTVADPEKRANGAPETC